MKGKVLRVLNNDLYGRADDRPVVVFATFLHKKYMNKYAVFVFQNEYNKNKLYYGSVHIKQNSLVVFKVRPELKNIFDEFLNQYTNNNLVDYELLDINELSRLEIVGYNEMDYDKILVLDELSIYKPPVITNTKKTSNSSFKILVPMIILIILTICTYVLFTPSLLEENLLTCNRGSYHDELRLNYQEKISIIFNGKNKIKEYKTDEIYKFRTTLKYQNFKDESHHFLYFEGNDKTYKYDDQELSLIVSYKKTTNEKDVAKLQYQLEQQGFSCFEEKYEK